MNYFLYKCMGQKMAHEVLSVSFCKILATVKSKNFFLQGRLKTILNKFIEDVREAWKFAMISFSVTSHLNANVPFFGTRSTPRVKYARKCCFFQWSLRRKGMVFLKV